MHHKRVVVTRYGGPEVITTVEEDIPAPTAGEVRVKSRVRTPPYGVHIVRMAARADR